MIFFQQGKQKIGRRAKTTKFTENEGPKYRLNYREMKCLWVLFVSELLCSSVLLHLSKGELGRAVGHQLNMGFALGAIGAALAHTPLVADLARSWPSLQTREVGLTGRPEMHVDFLSRAIFF